MSSITESNALELLILSQLLTNQEFRVTTLPYLKSDYFDNKVIKTIYSDIQSFITKYGTVPTKEALLISIPQNSMIGSIKDSEKVEVFEIINDILYTTYPDQKLEWLLDITEKFCKDKALYLALKKSIEIQSGIISPKENLTVDAIPHILHDALGISFNSNVGLNYFDDDEARFDYYANVDQSAGIITDLYSFNSLTNGVGIPKKAITVFMGGPGTGKTLIKSHLAASSIRQGYVGVYFTMEMANMRIAQRVDANLLEIDYNSIPHLDRDEYIKKMKKIRGKYSGKLIIEEFPTGMATVNHFRKMLDELYKKKQIEPDILFVDYINICSSVKFNGGNNSSMYSVVKSITEELRALAVERNVAVVTSTQVNRANLKNQNMDFDGVSESMGIPHTADLMLSIFRDEILDSANKIQFSQMKNRYNDILPHTKRFELGIRRPQFRLFDSDGITSTGQDSSGDVLSPFEEKYGKEDNNLNHFKGRSISNLY